MRPADPCPPRPSWPRPGLRRPPPWHAGAALLGLLGALAAADAAAGTRWQCRLSADLTQLICNADTDPAAEAMAAPPPTTARVRGTAFPLDPGQPWTVPLFSPATEYEPMALLARATICYRSPGCEVVLHAPELPPSPPAGPAPGRRARARL